MYSVVRFMPFTTYRISRHLYRQPLALKFMTFCHSKLFYQIGCCTLLRTALLSRPCLPAQTLWDFAIINHLPIAPHCPLVFYTHCLIRFLFIKYRFQFIPLFVRRDPFREQCIDCHFCVHHRVVIHFVNSRGVLRVVVLQKMIWCKWFISTLSHLIIYPFMFMWKGIILFFVWFFFLFLYWRWRVIVHALLTVKTPNSDLICDAMCMWSCFTTNSPIFVVSLFDWTLCRSFVTFPFHFTLFLCLCLCVTLCRFFLFHGLNLCLVFVYMSLAFVWVLYYKKRNYYYRCKSYRLLLA